ncbi:MAG: hypothetical protein J6W24_06015 [Prevotella sp.]|nr:hypothetical protein [Prevotella sp.]
MEEEENVNVLFMDTLLRYYMHIDPDTLSDKQWAWTLRYLYDIRKMENKTER